MEESVAKNTSTDPNLSTGQINRMFVLPPNLLSKLGLSTYNQSSSSVENDTTNSEPDQILQENDTVKDTAHSIKIEEEEIHSYQYTSNDPEGPNNANIKSTIQDNNTTTISHKELSSVQVAQGLEVQETLNIGDENNIDHSNLDNLNDATVCVADREKHELSYEKNTKISRIKKLNGRKGITNKLSNEINRSVNQGKDEDILLNSSDTTSHIVGRALSGSPKSDLLTENGNDIENQNVNSPMSISKSESISISYDTNDTSLNDSVEVTSNPNVCVTKQKINKKRKPRRTAKKKYNIDSNKKIQKNIRFETNDVLLGGGTTPDEVNNKCMQKDSFVPSLIDKSCKRKQTDCKKEDALPIKVRTSTKRLSKINTSYVDFDLSERTRKRKRSQDSEENSMPSKQTRNDISSCGTLNIDEEFLKVYINLKENVQNKIDQDTVVCKSCNKKTYDWEMHKLKHNNLTSTTTELSVDYTNDLTKDILEGIWQKTGVLICEKCCHAESTVTLFMMHIEQCKYTCKIICNLCDRKIKKSNRELHLEMHNSVKSDSVTVVEDADLKCAVCKQDTNQNEWKDHKLQHNNLAWCEGEKPINMSNKSVKKILQKVHKQNKKLVCFFCKYDTKTVADYVRHFRKCGPDHRAGNDLQDSNSNANDETAPEMDNTDIDCDIKMETEDPVHETSTVTENASEPEIVADDCGVVESAERTEEIQQDEVAKIKPAKGKGKPKSNNSNADVVCSKCNESMPKNKWIAHKLKHNNLAWNDQEEPLDLNDRKLCERILHAIIKKRKKLKCEHCDTVKKSVLGFVSHTDRCNKTEEEINQMRELCTLCGRTYFRTSMQVHMNQAHSGNKTSEAQVEQQKKKSIVEESNSTEGRTPRKAAAKALSIIDNMKKGIEDVHKKDISDMYTKPGAIRIPNPVVLCWKKEMSSSEDRKANCRNLTCEFRSSDIDELKSHHMSCELSTKRGYWCTVCSFRTNEESLIRDHIQSDHPKELEGTLESAKQDGAGEEPDDDDYSVNNDNDQNEEEESESEYDSERSTDNWDRKVTDCETNHGYLKRNRGVTKFSFFLMEKFVHGGAPICYPVAYKWTLKFREKNYSKEPLFPDWLRAPHSPIPGPLHVTYYGACQSCQIACVSGPYKKPKKTTTTASSSMDDNRQWRAYRLFEGTVDANHHDGGVATLFCGGPVWGLAWCPDNSGGGDAVPPARQYLAVSAHRHWDGGYEIDASLNKKDAKGAIQIWDVGVLDNAVGRCVTEPKLLYMIAHNLGAIWKLEWCPSGGQLHNEDENNGEETGNTAKRLGLLAVACSKGDIYIYSVCEPPPPPPPPKNTTTATDAPPLYDQKPVAVLRMNHLDESKRNYHSTALCWSKDSGHSTFAGGFSNGFIALWNLSIQSRLLKHTDSDDGVNCIHPYQIIKAHLSNVTALHLIPNQNGGYMFSASADRTIEFWRLDSASSGLVNAVPINSSGQLKGSRVTASAWNLHWLTDFLALDDICGRANSSFLALRDLTFKSTIMLNANSVVWDISTCDWSNGFVHVTEGGEVSCAYPHQLMAYVDSSKSMRTKKMVIGYSRIHKLDSGGGGGDTETKEAAANAADVKTEVVETDAAVATTNSTLLWNENASDNEDSNSKVPNENATENRNGNSNVIWENNYKDIVKNHGILFYDLPTVLDAKSCNLSELQSSAAPHYPLNSITRVCYNPNYHSHSFIAMGMQAGFVRIRCISGMRTTKRS